MEVILFHHKDKRTKSGLVNPAKVIKDLTAVVTPAELLTTPKRTALIQEIGALCALEPARFESLCAKLIYQLTNYCQNLPETSNSYYALPGGILDYALNRAEAALQLFRQYIVYNEGMELSEIQKLWSYALFSASLLKDIGKLQVDYQVEAFDPFGTHLKTWNPLIESLVSAASYYKFDFLPDNEEKTPLRRRLNLLIAHLMMPNDGFSWIASNPEVLATWLALLSDDWKSAGTLGAILIRADAIAIQRYFNENITHHIVRRGGARNARASTFIDSKPDKITAQDQLIGVEFIKWLTTALDAGQIMVNKSPLLMVPGGLLIHPDAFKLFVRAHPEYKNWQAVQNGFLSLGLHQTNANGEPLSRFEQSNNHQMHDGILFKKAAIALPNMVTMHNLYTGKSARISAIELIYLAQHSHFFVQQQHSSPLQPPSHLLASGKWKVMNNHHSPSLKTGFLKGG